MDIHEQIQKQSTACRSSPSQRTRNIVSTADVRTPVSVMPAMVSSTHDGLQPPEGEVQSLTVYWRIPLIKPPDSATVATEGGALDGDGYE